jgi:hypothetical protein
MVKVIKTFETVFFHAEEVKKKNDKTTPMVATVELTYNHATGNFTMCTANQEMVRFNNDTLEMLELKLEAVNAAAKYVIDLKKKRRTNV